MRRRMREGEGEGVRARLRVFQVRRGAARRGSPRVTAPTPSSWTPAAPPHCPARPRHTRRPPSGTGARAAVSQGVEGGKKARESKGVTGGRLLPCCGDHVLNNASNDRWHCAAPERDVKGTAARRKGRWAGRGPTGAVLTEALALSGPRLPSRNKAQTFEVESGQSTTLLCEAQAAPPPSTR